MYRVKSLSKSGNARKDQALPPINKDVLPASSQLLSGDGDDDYEQRQEVKVADMGRRIVDKDSLLNNSAADFDKQAGSFSSSYTLNGREEKGVASGSMDRERSDKNSYGDSNSQKMYSYSQNTVETEKVPKVSPPRRKVSRDDKSEKLGIWPKKDSSGDMSTTSSKQLNVVNYNTTTTGSRQYETETPDGNISAILEVSYNAV